MTLLTPRMTANFAIFAEIQPRFSHFLPQKSTALPIICCNFHNFHSYVLDIFMRSCSTRDTSKRPGAAICRHHHQRHSRIFASKYDCCYHYFYFYNYCTSTVTTNVDVAVVVDELDGDIATQRLVAVDRRHVNVTLPVPIRRVCVARCRSCVRYPCRCHHARSLPCNTPCSVLSFKQSKIICS